MPGPSLEYVCRALIQSVRVAITNTVRSKPALVAMHTSADMRQATTDSHPGDPALLTFPCLLVQVPTLTEDLDRRQPLGFNVYRSSDRTRLTMLKEPYPRYYDLGFRVRIEAERLTGDGGLLALVQAMTAWIQESPRVAGLIAEWRTTFMPDEEASEGDIIGATGHIRLRDWASYGGPPKVVRLIGTTELTVTDEAPTSVSWQPEDSVVSTAILAAVQPLDAPGPIAVGEQGTAIARGVDGAWFLDARTNTTAALCGLWGTSATNLIAVGDGGTILRRQRAANAITWLAEASPTLRDLHAVWGFSNDVVYAVGDDGTVLHYDGAAWTSMLISIAAGCSLRALWGNPVTGRLWVVGDDGLILRREPDASWAEEVSNTPAALFAVIGDRLGNLYAAGDDGVLLGSAGDGVWSPVDGVGSGQANTLRSACAFENDLFVAGDFGTVIRKSSSGWGSERTGSQSDLFVVAGAGVDDIYVAGEAGTMLHRARRQ